jgi:hypothetical protein
MNGTQANRFQAPGLSAPSTASIAATGSTNILRQPTSLGTEKLARQYPDADKDQRYRTNVLDRGFGYEKG